VPSNADVLTASLRIAGRTRRLGFGICDSAWSRRAIDMAAFVAALSADRHRSGSLVKGVGTKAKYDHDSPVRGLVPLIGTSSPHGEDLRASKSSIPTHSEYPNPDTYSYTL
jgi:hypothetical protein